MFDWIISVLRAVMALLQVIALLVAYLQNYLPFQMQVGLPYPGGIMVTTNQLLQPAGTESSLAAARPTSS